jgi:hypothetical protein
MFPLKADRLRTLVDLSRKPRLAELLERCAPLVGTRDGSLELKAQDVHVNEDFVRDLQAELETASDFVQAVGKLRREDFACYLEDLLSRPEKSRWALREQERQKQSRKSHSGGPLQAAVIPAFNMPWRRGADEFQAPIKGVCWVTLFKVRSMDDDGLCLLAKRASLEVRARIVEFYPDCHHRVLGLLRRKPLDFQKVIRHSGSSPTSVRASHEHEWADMMRDVVGNAISDVCQTSRQDCLSHQLQGPGRTADGSFVILFSWNREFHLLCVTQLLNTLSSFGAKVVSEFFVTTFYGREDIPLGTEQGRGDAKTE